MGKQSEHARAVESRSVTAWLLFAVATAMAVFFLNTGTAYGQTNSDSTTNTSDGGADVASGDAGATGNESATDSGQGASVSGHNGSITVVRQSNTVNNAGVAVANTGGNEATGNQTNGDTAAIGTQSAAGGSISNNNGSASNSSNGSSSITTGDATANGNVSSTDIHQEANVDAYGGLGSIVIVTQDVEVNNVGVGVANTGLNEATGNRTIGDSTATVPQEANSLPAGGIAANNGSASNSTNGSADIDTGDAAASGNVSATNVSQVANVNAGGSLGGLVVVRQSADVNNVGVGISNTGLNEATGNFRVGDATAVTSQEASAGSILGPPGGGSGLGVASNDGTASNTSDGTARIGTGDAWSTGNHSETHITQSANTYVGGGGFIVTLQDADVNNIGVAVANTGLNGATGNRQIGSNVAVVPQSAVGLAIGPGDDTAIAGNFATASNNTDGTAEIGTGNATAIGNTSSTSINQSANSALGGDDADGFIVPVQNATVNNIGVGIANTGLNEATGNFGIGALVAITPQEAAAIAPGGGDDVAVAGNFGEASNTVDGTARIRTGNANGTGNESHTVVNQASASYIGGDGFIVPVQNVDVNNIGVGIANTGLNEATGNQRNGAMVALVPQEVTAEAGDDDDDVATAGNFGSATNSSNGTASIDTGNADAWGNVSGTVVNQSSANYIGGDGFIVPVQTADVNNIGVGVANSGLNEATGNFTNSAMVAEVPAEATAVTAGDGDDTAIAGNFGSATNTSDGTAEITTGDACAAGNNSTTYITQNAGSGIEGDGFIVPIQSADVNNIGVGIANSGLNQATGNRAVGDASMSAVVPQAAIAVTPGPGDDLVTASNDAQASNSRSGSAAIHTGAANAEGNRSATGVTQTSNAYLAGTGFVVPVQTADVDNVGVAIANSGLNEATGNFSLGEMTAVTPQAAIAIAPLGGDDTAIAANRANASNSTDGDATITTGDACAAGNVAANVINQNSAVYAPDAAFVVTIQDADILNAGVGIANSGLNGATGNRTIGDMAAVTPQVALAVATGGGDDTAIANNIASASNSTNGSVDISTGHADATGNWATNGVSQEAHVYADTPLNVTVQNLALNNLGVGIANTGLNEATGHHTIGDSIAVSPQVAEADADGDLAIANNIGETSNASDGSVDIATGNATATGNQASNLSCQATNGVCPDLAFPPLPDPLCPCHRDEEVPEQPEVPEEDVEAPRVPGVPGEQLPVTGGPLAAQAALGLLLVILGAALRRRRLTA
jgi:hypothetical protein